MAKKVNEGELEKEAIADKEVDKQQLGEAVNKEPANKDTNHNVIEVETVELVVSKDGILKKAEEKRVGAKEDSTEESPEIDPFPEPVVGEVRYVPDTDTLAQLGVQSQDNVQGEADS